MVQCKVEPTESCTCDTHEVRMDWWHLSRKSPSVASASLFVGAPVTIASLLNPWLAKAFFAFTFAALWIGCIEAFVHFVRHVKANVSVQCCAVVGLLAALSGHAFMLWVTYSRGWGAETPLVACIIISTGCYVLGFGLMLVLDQWWYAITPSQMLLFIVALHSMGILLLTLD